MRTELTYAVDAMARYNGEYVPAVENVTEYHKAGGLSDAYYSRVKIFMYWVSLANNGQYWAFPTKWHKRVTKAIRAKMPRVHTERSNWALTWEGAMADAAQARTKGRKMVARACIREARHIRQIYL